MGFLGSLGRALTAPIRHTNKIVGKSPGMGAAMGAMNKIPGMQTANKLNPMMMGLQQDPNLASKAGAGAGIGPSPAVAPVDPGMTPPDQTPQIPQMQPDYGSMAAGIAAGMGGGARSHVMPSMGRSQVMPKQKMGRGY